MGTPVRKRGYGCPQPVTPEKARESLNALQPQPFSLMRYRQRCDRIDDHPRTRNPGSSCSRQRRQLGQDVTPACVMFASLRFFKAVMLEREARLTLSTLGKLQRDSAPLAGVRRKPGEGQSRIALDLEVLTSMRYVVTLDVHHDQEPPANAWVALHLCYGDARPATHESLECVRVKPRVEHHTQRGRNELFDHHRRSSLGHFEFPFL